MYRYQIQTTSTYVDTGFIETKEPMPKSLITKLELAGSTDDLHLMLNGMGVELQVPEDSMRKHFSTKIDEAPYAKPIDRKTFLTEELQLVQIGGMYKVLYIPDHSSDVSDFQVLMSTNDADIAQKYFDGAAALITAQQAKGG